MNWTDARVPAGAGVVTAGYEKVAEAFAENFQAGLELGAAFAVMRAGEHIVDIRGGFVDKAAEKPWSPDTIACVYSSGKAVLALLVARAVSEGALSYEAPVSDYWPEFAEAGKAEITVAEMMSHQAGLCGIQNEMAPETWLDWEAVTRRLAAMAPLWTPGTKNGYHPQTFGFLAGEILRRVTGKSVGELIRSLNERWSVGVYCGMGDAEMARAAYMPKPPRAPDLGEINEPTRVAFLTKWASAARISREAWMAAEIPASNMHTNAASLAAIVHPIANKGRQDSEQYLTSSAIEGVLHERCRGDDLVLPFHLSWSAGLMKNINKHFGPHEGAYGHSGFGGSCVLIDPVHNLSAAYVMNKMSPYLVGDPRGLKMLNALYECL